MTLSECNIIVQIIVKATCTFILSYFRSSISRAINQLLSSGSEVEDSDDQYVSIYYVHCTCSLSAQHLLYFFFFRTDGEPDSESEFADEFTPTPLPGLFE